MMRRFFVAVTLLLLMPTSARADWHQREAAIMGTRITAELWHEESTAGQAALDAVFAEMHRIDRLMSHYKPNSQLSRINRDAAAGPVVVDHELALLIAKSLELPELFGTGFIRIEPKGDPGTDAFAHRSARLCRCVGAVASRFCGKRIFTRRR